MWGQRIRWVNKLPNNLRETQQEVIKNKKDLIRNIIQGVKEKSREGEDKTEESLQQIEAEMSENIEKVFMKSLEEFQYGEKPTAEKKEPLQPPQTDNQEVVLDFLMQKYHNIIKQFIYSTPYYSSELKNLSQSDRDLAWKGILIGNFLSGLKVKSYVQDKLHEMHLNEDISLKEFYEKTTKKLRISFTAVDMETQTITMLNHITRPNMPVFGASSQLLTSLI